MAHLILERCGCSHVESVCAFQAVLNNFFKSHMHPHVHGVQLWRRERRC